MRNVRGSAYRRAMAEVTPALVARARRLIGEQGKFTLTMVATLAQEFDLPVKTTCEFLEYAEVLPSGTWERLAEKTKREVRGLAQKLAQRD